MAEVKGVLSEEETKKVSGNKNDPEDVWLNYEAVSFRVAILVKKVEDYYKPTGSRDIYDNIAIEYDRDSKSFDIKKFPYVGLQDLFKKSEEIVYISNEIKRECTALLPRLSRKALRKIKLPYAIKKAKSGIKYIPYFALEEDSIYKDALGAKSLVSLIAIAQKVKLPSETSIQKKIDNAIKKAMAAPAPGAGGAPGAGAGGGGGAGPAPAPVAPAPVPGAGVPAAPGAGAGGAPGVPAAGGGAGVLPPVAPPAPPVAPAPVAPVIPIAPPAPYPVAGVPEEDDFDQPAVIGDFEGQQRLVMPYLKGSDKKIVQSTSLQPVQNLSDRQQILTRKLGDNTITQAEREELLRLNQTSIDLQDLKYLRALPKAQLSTTDLRRLNKLTREFGLERSNKLVLEPVRSYKKIRDFGKARRQLADEVDDKPKGKKKTYLDLQPDPDKPMVTGAGVQYQDGEVIFAHRDYFADSFDYVPDLFQNTGEIWGRKNGNSEEELAINPLTEHNYVRRYRYGIPEVDLVYQPPPPKKHHVDFDIQHHKVHEIGASNTRNDTRFDRLLHFREQGRDGVKQFRRVANRGGGLEILTI